MYPYQKFKRSVVENADILPVLFIVWVEKDCKNDVAGAGRTGVFR
jgi:hypothetical protein